MDSDSLLDLYRRALSAASSASDLPTADPKTQELLSNAQSLLREITSRVSKLALFSSNELLEDISTRNLAFLFPPFVFAEIESRLITNGRQERIARILQSQKYHQLFTSSLELYEIVTQADKSLYSKRASAVADPAKRRELKIAQYKQEKQIRSKIDAIKTRQRPDTTDSNTFDLIAGLLPTPNADAEDDEDDDAVREITLLLLRSLYAQSHAQLESSEQELDLLRNAPPSPPRQPPQTLGDDLEGTWKLDTPRSQGGPDGKGPLMDPSGKPLRPFTILPAGASADRARLQDQVFGPGHRLPSMSVDEYLEIERQRGNIITGGGAASEAELTTSEQLALDSEMDGTAFAAEREEAKRQKDESWARYTDSNPKGAGNTMNRG